MQLKRKAALACLTLAGILCVLYLGTWAVVRTPQFQSWVENRARRAGVDLTLGSISLAFPFDLVVSSVNATSAASFEFSSQAVRADLNPMALLFGELSELTLVEPRLRIPMAASSGGGEAARVAFVIRSLNIQNGRVDLDMGNDAAISIPDIDLTGHDLNLGGQSGQIETTAYVPELDADLKVRFSAASSGLKASLEMVQPRGPKITGDTGLTPTGKSSGVLSLQFEPDAGLRFSGNMNLDRFAFDFITVTGMLDLSAELDANRGIVTLELQAEATDLTGLGPVANPAALFPLSAKVKGQYDMDNKRLMLSDLRITAPVETLTGNATVSLEKEPLLAGVVEIPKVALTRFTGLLPPDQAAVLQDIDGELSAKLTVTGKLNPWSFAGVVETTATQTKLAGARIQSLEGRLPFAFRSGSIEATDLRLIARQVSWQPSGQKLDVGLASLVTSGKLQYSSAGTQSFDGRIEVSGGRFATDDGLTAAESIKGTASLRVERSGEDVVRTQLKAKLDTMEFLWHRFFADFKPEQPELNVSGTYDLRTQTLRIERGRLGLERIGAVEMNGGVRVSADTPSFDVHVSASSLRLANFYNFFVRETFKTSQPLIEALQLTGTASADLVSRGVAQKFSVEGTARLAGMEIKGPEGWRIGPVDGTLPFKIEYPEGPAQQAATPVPRGSVAIRGIRFGESQVPPFTVFLSLWDNAFSLVKPVHMFLYGGSFVVERLAWRDIVAAPRKFSFSGRIDDISLAPMTRDLGWYQFNGNLSGMVPQVTWANDTFRTDGQLEVRVFEGQVRIDNLEVSTLAGALPRIKVDVEIRDIDLERATKVFEFGTISGILAGKIDGLVISNGQPSQFRADVHTVPRSGVSQWISVEALNKIVVLGSGNGGSAPYGLLAGFFDFYRYRRIGFKAQLRNDLLILHGIRSEKGKEFLVEGSLIPPTVNVVSHMQRISFKELVSRLERIGKIGPSTSTPPQ